MGTSTSAKSSMRQTLILPEPSSTIERRFGCGAGGVGGGGGGVGVGVRGVGSAQGVRGHAGAWVREGEGHRASTAEGGAGGGAAGAWLRALLLKTFIIEPTSSDALLDSFLWAVLPRGVAAKSTGIFASCAA